MRKQVGRYSKYLRPGTVIIDLIQLFLFAYLFLPNVLQNWYFSFFATTIWLLLSFYTKFYEVFRFTKIIQIASKTLRQFGFFTVFCFAYVGFVSKGIESSDLLKFIFSSLISISTVKLCIFLSLKIFRKHYKGNHRKVIIIGKDKLSNQLSDFFRTEKDYGYDLIKHFSSPEINECIEYVSNNKIDEIYLSLENMEAKLINTMILFCDNQFINLKYIPSKKEIVANPSKIEYYGLIPIIPEHKTPLEIYHNKLLKRAFDVAFSFLVIIFILSWLFPLVAIIIKIESRGPVLFKQKRNGLFFEEFYCYKFRSMIVNKEADTHQAIKNDKRITKFGKFLRKTSIDEMPQFFNVLIGNMSICGPRPHMITFTNQYATDISRYKMRHFVKPGITGMAQTHGYRGEIENKRDIVNRIKYDLFYIQNWSILLDIKIIFLTIKNGILGDKKAY